ncbi:hypothetical protein PPL_05170 [Heterostelium album PN500]|uniref:Uncharacterized protein n=1 Tax=Heterostelium pallidum (strain ATCC 26659 / Pp 5 / PN500) TaxID=670386 RepID=D3B9M5_HETP5|nr:hypothetical protein PPL_05170 [Heterostelium album PN500]EFA81937.1 hypothetical protein PPL_05170 [Heterostelium album PN500]|eukprot:XP_020434054.1 hypothetical protein PPL_05170 [Heterostelium album PN500]
MNDDLKLLFLRDNQDVICLLEQNINNLIVDKSIFTSINLNRNDRFETFLSTGKSILELKIKKKAYGIPLKEFDKLILKVCSKDTLELFYDWLKISKKLVQDDDDDDRLQLYYDAHRDQFLQHPPEEDQEEDDDYPPDAHYIPAPVNECGIFLAMVNDISDSKSDTAKRTLEMLNLLLIVYVCFIEQHHQDQSTITFHDLHYRYNNILSEFRQQEKDRINLLANAANAAAAAGNQYQHRQYQHIARVDNHPNQNNNQPMEQRQRATIIATISYQLRFGPTSIDNLQSLLLQPLGITNQQKDHHSYYRYDEVRPAMS